MAINIKFDSVGNPEPPTIILANRNGNMLGQLKVNNDSIELFGKLSDASEISFTINKYMDGKLTPLWDKVVDFKLVYCKEWDRWFEIKLDLDESTETVKTVYCTQLGHAELSQIMLYNIEINTEKDIERDDYKISILYDPDHPEASILHRILKDKAPHYSIVYVSPTIAKIQRSFSFNGTSILDSFREIEVEIGCLFQFYDVIENGRLQRKISVFDLQQYCNDCGYRGEYTDKCPKCNSTNITSGYGEDTLIFVTSDELAAEGIQLVTDTDSVKNCFKLEAGDDLMTATVRNCNPNGTEYIWYFSDDMKEDMPKDLVDKLESYDELYRHQYSDSVSNINEAMLVDYNSLVDKYSVYDKDLQKIETPITGYSNLMNAYYNTVDLSLYLQSALMPSVEISETNAVEQASLLTSSSLSPVAVADVDIVSLTTANSAVLAMAKVVVKSTFKVEIKSSELYTSSGKKYWKGKFIVTNYSDNEDTAESNEISVELNDDLETVTKQKIEKVLNKENTDDLSITGLFKREYNDFCAELKKYALNPLTSFYESCQACIDILIDQGVGNKNSWSDNEEGSEANLYEKLYLPYYNKLKAIEAEMKIREDEISIILGTYDTDGNLIVEGLQSNIEECRNRIQSELNFKDYLGEDLWLEFCAYRREDTYSNDNYISDGLDNAELFKRAQEFFKVAENEIYKSAELQHSISTTLNNLLAIEKFKPLIESFNVGNWIRVQIDDKIFKLRLLEYGIDFGNFENITVEFSDVTKIKNGITDVESILSKASSMATSYDAIQRQANQGNEAQSTIEEWLVDGLNSALVNIQSNDNEDITLTKNGLLCRSYDDITGTYSPEQFKLTHNIMAYTTDDWRTVSSALGKHEYTKWQNNQWIKDIDYGLSSKFVTAGYVTGSQIIGGEIVSSNYKSGESGTYFNLIDGDFEIAGGNIVYNTSDKALTLRNVTIEWANTNAPEVTINDITGLDGYLEQLDEVEDKANSAYTLANNAKSVADNAKTVGDNLVNGLGFKETEISGNYVISPVIAGGTLLIGNTSGTYAQITTDGKLICTGADISGTITATAGEIGGCNIVDGNLQIKSANITDKLSADKIDVTSVITVGGIATTGDVETITNTTITNTSVTAQNLKVNAANISGQLTANQIDATNLKVSSANITGDLTANKILVKNASGTKTLFYAGDNQVTIGNWNVDSNSLYSTYEDSASRVFICTGTASQYTIGGYTDNWYFGAGSSTGAGFGVSTSGKLYASNAEISGTITSDNIEVTGGAINIPVYTGNIQTGYCFMDYRGVGCSHHTNDNATIIAPNGIIYQPTDYLIRGSSTIIDIQEAGLGTLTKTLVDTWYIGALGSAVQVTSDKNVKYEIQEQLDIYSEIFDKLIPVTYKYKNGTSGRTHTGFIAQDVEDAVKSVGLETIDFAAVCYDLSEDGEKINYGIRYEELVSMCVYEIQKLKQRVAELEAKLEV